MARWYVGHTNRGTLTAFTADTEPTEASHGATYGAVIGPFRTRRAAFWAERHGANNPHFAHVNDAERIAREQS